MIDPKKCFANIVLAAGLVTIAVPTAALLPPADPEVVLADAYKGKSYSPYAGRGFASRPLWGDRPTSLRAVTRWFRRTARQRGFPGTGIALFLKPSISIFSIIITP
jgi:hypothetical protein